MPAAPRALALPAGWQAAVLWLAGANTLGTRRTYTKVLRAFAAECGAPPGQVTRLHILGYKATLVTRNLSPKTIRARLSALRSFFAWCIEEGLHPGPNPVDRVKLPKEGGEVAGRALDDAQLRALVDQARNARDRALLLLLAEVGLRAEEAMAMTERDFHGGDYPVALVRRGKGGRVRQVPIPERAAGALGEYLAACGRRRGPTEPLFQDLEGLGRRLTYSNLYRVVCDCALRAGIGHVAPHDLRRTYVTLRLDAGDPLPAVQRDAGHVTMTETAGYYRAAGRYEGNHYQRKGGFPSPPGDVEHTR